jgi:hypothetical protein
MKLTPIKKFDLQKIKKSNYETCISCSIFKMRTAYKPFNQYMDAFINWVGGVSKKVMVRLHVDESIIRDESYQTLLDKNFDNLEIFKYVDERFLEDDNIHHDGTFGTMPRFMALFDKELRDVYKIKYFWISDVDLEPQMFDYNFINNMKKANCDVSYASFACYDRPWIPDDVEFPMVIYRVILKSNVKVSKKVFDDFLQDTYEGKYKNVKDEIAEYYSKDKPKTDAGLSAKYFIYGFDEIYANSFLVRELTKYKQLIYYGLSLGRFTRYLEIPDKKKLYAYEGMARQGKGNLRFNINQLKKIHVELTKFLDKQDLTNLPKRMQICFDEYKKYKNKIRDDLPEFMAMLVRYP